MIYGGSGRQHDRRNSRDIPADAYVAPLDLATCRVWKAVEMERVHDVSEVAQPEAIKD